MRRALEAGARERRDRAAIVGRIGPERQRALILGVGLVQPAGARVDHAVDEELRNSGPPTAAAGIAVRKQRLPVLRLRLRDDRERDDEALDEIAVRLELAQEVVRRERPVHRVTAGQGVSSKAGLPKMKAQGTIASGAVVWYEVSPDETAHVIVAPITVPVTDDVASDAE